MDTEKVVVLSEGGELAQTQPEYDVFLSYNSKDREEVAALYETLRGMGLSVWFDSVDTEPGPIVRQLENAIRSARAAAICIGKYGKGDWQSHEADMAFQTQIDALRNRGGDDRSFRLVPVLLPGVTPDDLQGLFLSNYASVDLQKTLNDKAETSRLYKFLTGEDLAAGAYEIHVEVQDAAVTCFAAVPSEGCYGICEIIRSAVKEVNNKLSKKKEIGFRCGISDPSAFHYEIRTAEAVVADCTPGPAGVRDATVMYQLGLSQAIGKPVIIVTAPGDDFAGILPSPYVVYCDRTQAGYQDKLRDDLVVEMTKIDFSAVFRLVAPDSHDIAAAYSDWSVARPMLFKDFQTVFRDGLTIYRHFREIGKHLHRIDHSIKDLETEFDRLKREEKIPIRAIEGARSTFQRHLFSAFNELKDIFEDNDNEFSEYLLRDFAVPKETEAWVAFERLLNKTKRGARSCIKDASLSFETTGNRIAAYFQEFDDFAMKLLEVVSCFQKKRDPQQAIEELYKKFIVLNYSMHQVEKSTNEMLTTLLGLIAQRGASGSGNVVSQFASHS
jgi:hypothetical protein